MSYLLANQYFHQIEQLKSQHHKAQAPKHDRKHQKNWTKNYRIKLWPNNQSEDKSVRVDLFRTNRTAVRQQHHHRRLINEDESKFSNNIDNIRVHLMTKVEL